MPLSIYEYSTPSEFKQKLKQRNIRLVDFILERECKLFGVERKKILRKLLHYLTVMREAINEGLSARDRLFCIENDAKKLKKNSNTNMKLLNDLEYEILLSAIAVAYNNCQMGKIIACPTAGACGILPGLLIPLSNQKKISEARQIEALIVAGEIGRLIAEQTSISGAVGGCMVECGVASAMSAAAVTYLFNENINVIFNAAALALKNNLGLTCDPVAGLVEAPCVKRNGFKALEALTAAQLALVGVCSAIPFDEVILAVKQTANDMDKKYKETAIAGLAATPTAKRIERKIRGQTSLKSLF